MKEIEIKVHLIKWLLKNSPSELLIGSEVRFDFGSRRVDVVTLNENIACAYEIKGAGDSLKKLVHQVNGYKKYFDECYIVCERKNISAVRNIIGTEIGIILIDSDHVLPVRKSKRFKNLCKLSLMSTVDISYLKQLIKKNKASKHQLCNHFIEKNKLSEVKEVSREFLKKKLEIPFKTFLKEVGQEINYDDISTLNRMPSIALFSQT
ncbi:sce7726 family protein [Serratia inhibens]|uniref:sce7726 family protein n=1 Tax=Serratia inhibens TaxID=2338073 RepID=UPI0008096B1E|nr:sce7726 family protein [Serratia inhibens]ANS43743.1 hypothetical protein Q5A_016485 [Serratia inhibens PRI-2C]